MYIRAFRNRYNVYNVSFVAYFMVRTYSRVSLRGQFFGTYSIPVSLNKSVACIKILYICVNHLICSTAVFLLEAISRSLRKQQPYARSFFILHPPDWCDRVQRQKWQRDFAKNRVMSLMSISASSVAITFPALMFNGCCLTQTIHQAVCYLNRMFLEEKHPQN